VKVLFYSIPPDIRKTLLFGGLSEFARLSFWCCARCSWRWVWSIGRM